MYSPACHREPLISDTVIAQLTFQNLSHNLKGKTSLEKKPKTRPPKTISWGVDHVSNFERSEGEVPGAGFYPDPDSDSDDEDSVSSARRYQRMAKVSVGPICSVRESSLRLRFSNADCFHPKFMKREVWGLKSNVYFQARR